ncbi:MAG: class I SAM-dependent methyltransferase [Cyclobacteriaceae bacterium]|nr:class I SAM-dependent methyltransferase [Cyclobacteriaceae bacterium]
MKLLLFPLSLIIFTSQAQDAWKNIYTESAWKERDAWQKADAIMKYLDLRFGSKVADIGCHEGYMTMKLSREVGDLGKVYAVDVEQNRLDKLKEHLQDRGIQNVITTKGDYDNPHLPANTLDGALIIDTYHEMDEHDAMLQQIKSSLRIGGILIICEPIADERRNLARSDQERKHELDMKFALEDLERAGFRVTFQQDPFINREKIKGDNMWLVVARRVK